MRRRKAGDRSPRTLGHQGAVAHGQGTVGDFGIRVAPLDLPVGAPPRHVLPYERLAGQSRIVQDRPSFFLGMDHGLHVHQWTVAVEREDDLALERPDGQIPHGHAGATPLAVDAHAPRLELPQERLVWPLGRFVEERVEDAHLRRTIRRCVPRSDRQEEERLNALQQLGWPGRAGYDSQAFDQRLPGTQIDREPAGLVRTNWPTDVETAFARLNLHAAAGCISG